VMPTSRTQGTDCPIAAPTQLVSVVMSLPYS